MLLSGETTTSSSQIKSVKQLVQVLKETPGEPESIVSQVEKIYDNANTNCTSLPTPGCIMFRYADGCWLDGKHLPAPC
jgi:hypothetical protein